MSAPPTVSPALVLVARAIHSPSTARYIALHFDPTAPRTSLDLAGMSRRAIAALLPAFAVHPGDPLVFLMEAVRHAPESKGLLGQALQLPAATRRRAQSTRVLLRLINEGNLRTWQMPTQKRSTPVFRHGLTARNTERNADG